MANVNFKQGSLSNINDVAINAGTIYSTVDSINKTAMLFIDDANNAEYRYPVVSPFGPFAFFCDSASNTTIKILQQQTTISGNNAYGFNKLTGSSIIVHFLSGFTLTSNTCFQFAHDTNSTKYGVTYHNASNSQKYLSAGAYLFCLIRNRFHLIGDISEVNNGIALTAASDTNYHPLLIGATGLNGADSLESVTAVTNPDKAITATLDIGRINAPGGLLVHGGSATDGTESRFTIDHSGFEIDGRAAGGDYALWSMYPDTLGRLIFDGVGDNGYMHVQLDLEGQALRTQNIIATQNLYRVDANGEQCRIPTFYYGTTKPTSDIGEDGDIYIMYS